MMAPRPGFALLAVLVATAVAVVIGFLLVQGAEWAVINALRDLPTGSGEFSFAAWLNRWWWLMLVTIATAVAALAGAVVVRLQRQRVEPNAA